MIRTFLSLSRAERGALLAAIPVVLTIRVALWVLPSRAIVRLTRRVGAWSRRPLPRGGVPADVAWAVDAVGRRVPRASCLTQALAAQLLLLRRGVDSELCLGVARDPGGDFRAHAWLERQGRIVFGGQESRVFTRLPDLARGGFAPAAERSP